MPTTPVNYLSAFTDVPRKLFGSLAVHGLRGTLGRLHRKVDSKRRERRLGIRTTGSISGEELSFDASSFGYQPVPYASFDAAMRYVSIRPEQDVFIDFGCGMGRAVVLAATFPFRRVIGVERSADLSRIASDNVDRAASSLRCSDVSIVTIDARDFQLPADATHIFLFNPFDEPVVLAVLEKLRESHREHPRHISIIYALPKCRRDPLLNTNWLTLCHELKTIDSDWQRLAIYETP